MRSPLLDLLVGPHGIDRYLELLRADLTVRDARAEVIGVRRQTARSVTLTLRPNSAWSGFRAGQFVRVGVEIDGVRRTRTYSPACSEHAAGGLLELTVTVHPEGLVSRHLQSKLAVGAIVHLGAGQGELTLPRIRPRRLVLVSGGSGVTPLISMLRTLREEQHTGEIVFLHYARTAADWLYRSQALALAAGEANIRVAYVATREGGARLSADTLRSLAGDLDGAHGAVCGPPALIESMRGAWTELQGDRELLRAETFTVTKPIDTGAAAQGTLRFLHSGRDAAICAGTLLEQAEAAGLSPRFGCRMGICHTCTCRKTAGAVRNALTGELSEEEDEVIQLCVSIPAGDVALEI